MANVIVEVLDCESHSRGVHSIGTLGEGEQRNI